MTQYEKIKQMSVDEMALCFYASALPFLEDYTKQEKYEYYKELLKFLKSEA